MSPTPPSDHLSTDSPDDDVITRDQAELNDTAELKRFLAAYRPTGVSVETWLPLSDAAAALVLNAGRPTRARVEKDVQLLGAIVTHLVERGRPVTLDEALSDAALASFDSTLKASPKTRENKRGIARRLQAAHHGLPWRVERRTDGERAKNLVSHTEVARMHRALNAAQATADEVSGAAALVTAVSAAQALRAGVAPDRDVDAATWTQARRFAADHDLSLTRPTLRAIVTHEVLERYEPVAVLIDRFGLTRQDLDLALTRVAELPRAPSTANHDLLRGGS